MKIEEAEAACDIANAALVEIGLPPAVVIDRNESGYYLAVPWWAKVPEMQAHRAMMLGCLKAAPRAIGICEQHIYNPEDCTHGTAPEMWASKTCEN